METQTSALRLDHSELPSFPIICQPGLPVKQRQADLCEWPSSRLYSAQPVQLYVAAPFAGTAALPPQLLSHSILFIFLYLLSCFHLWTSGAALGKLGAWFSRLSFLSLPTPH